MKKLSRYILVCILLSSFIPAKIFAVNKDIEQNPKITQALEKVTTWGEKNSIPLPYIRQELIRLFKKAKTKNSKKVIGNINMHIEELLEEKYHGPIRFEVHGKTAYMFGKIHTGIEKTVKDLFINHPNIKIIKLIYVPGSFDDFENFKTIHFLREKGIITYLPRKGFIASGGVDFLLAGKRRIIEKGAKVGIHSWRYDDINDANALPKIDEHHKVWLKFYKSIGISTDYYRFLIAHATADKVYRMTEKDLIHFGFVERIK